MATLASEMKTLIPRDRVQLEFVLPSDTYAPGDTINGVLNVTVQKTVSITAIRVHLVGKEKCSVGGEKKAEDREFVHLERLITLFGFSVASGRRSGAELAEGVYEYPFALNIPDEAPPSYATQLPRKSSFYSRLTYKLTATAVIPYSVDRSVQRELTVISLIPKPQFQSAADKVKMLPSTELELVKSDSCCASKKREFVELSASTHPYYILLPTDEAVACENGSSGHSQGKTETAERTDRPTNLTDAGHADHSPATVATRRTTTSIPTQNYSTFDSARKNTDGAAAPTTQPGPSAPEASYTHFDSARKTDDPYNTDRKAVEPVDEIAPPQGPMNPAPVTRWTSGAAGGTGLHANHISALNEAERLAARELGVTVTVHNHTESDITFIRLSLVQHRTVSSGGATESSQQVVSTRDIIPSPPLHPGEQRRFDEMLTFTGTMRTHEDNDKKTLTRPVPTMTTNMMRSDTTEFTVSFPKMKNLAGLALITNVCAFASDVSTNALLPTVPARYAKPFMFPEVCESAL